jgi:rubrerythrin
MFFCEVEAALATMTATETELGVLYKEFAARYPEGRDLWARLAVEENGHAAQVRSLTDKVRSGELVLDPGRLKQELYDGVLAEIRTLATQCRQTPLTLPQALAATGAIEDSLLDNHLFEIFDSDQEPLRRVFTILRNESQAHAARTRELLQRFK